MRLTDDELVRSQVQQALQDMFANTQYDFFAPIVLAVWSRTELISREAVRAELKRLLTGGERTDE